MTTIATKARNLARAWGATITIADTDDGKQIDITAPDGLRWVAGPATLIARYAGTCGPAAEAYNDLVERMSLGCEPHTD